MVLPGAATMAAGGGTTEYGVALAGEASGVATAIGPGALWTAIGGGDGGEGDRSGPAQPAASATTTGAAARAKTRSAPRNTGCVNPSLPS